MGRDQDKDHDHDQDWRGEVPKGANEGLGGERHRGTKAQGHKGRELTTDYTDGHGWGEGMRGRDHDHDQDHDYLPVCGTQTGMDRNFGLWGRPDVGLA